MSGNTDDGGEMEQPSVTFNPEMPMNVLEVAEENVRKHKQEAGIDDLANSIKHIGLIQPIVVAPQGNKFKVVVGQRRYLAVKKLGLPNIKALIIGTTDSRILTMYSFGENIHRRALPYDDTIEVCNVLFGDYKGSRTERIRQIAADLGVSYPTVRKYIAHQLIPKEVRQMVKDKLMSGKLAERITNAFWPNDKRIIAVSKEMKNLTADEFERLLKLGEVNPDRSLDELEDEAKKPPPEEEVTITMGARTKKWYEDEADKRNTTFNDLIREALDDFMEGEISP